MIRHSHKTAITIAVALIFILALVGSASAGNAVQLKIKGNGKLVDGARIFESDNDAVAERTLEVTLNGPGKLAYFDAGTVHAENTDGSIVADVNVTKIEVSGKSTGTGTVVANATVKAEGHNILDVTGAVVGLVTESEVESFVDLNAGAKGTAEGTAFAAGTATATGVLATGETVDTSATGTTSASGKVTSTNPSDFYAEGEIEGEGDVFVDGTMDDPVSMISSEVFGIDAASGSASASGSATANSTNLDGVIVSTSAEGATSASGTSTKGGFFDTEAEIFAEGIHDEIGFNKAFANVWTGVYTAGDSKTAKVTSSASATGEAGAEVLFPTFTPYYNAEAEGQAKGSASSSGIGESWAFSELEGYVEDFGVFTWEQPLPLDVPNALFILVGGELVDDSLIQSEAGAIGEGGYKGSASTSAAGEAEAAGNLEDDGVELTDFSNSFAEGMTIASASATGTGEAISGSVILSLDVINGGGFIELLDLSDELDPEMAPAQPPDGDGQGGVLATFEFPTSSLADVSIIGDFAMANGESSKDTAKACASAAGATGASGAVEDTQLIDTANATTFAAGVVNASASVGAKADPFAASIIGSVSIPGVSDDSLVDASLIAGIAESDGPKGAASASADGVTSAAGFVEFVTNLSAVLVSHTDAAGETDAAVSSTDGFALSFANIGSANYESFDDVTIQTVTGADLVDASLIGGVSIADGKAKAESSATGFTASNGLFIAEDSTDVPFVTITGHSEAATSEDTVATEVTSFGGLGVAAAGVGSVNVIDWLAAGVTGPQPSVTVVDASLVGDFVLAEGDSPSDRATAEAYADGATNANGAVNDTTFASGLLVNANSFAAGEVDGFASANAICDPISLSVIASVAVAEQESDGDKTLVEVSTIDSASLSTGKCSEASGAAEGATGANGQVLLNETVEDLDTTTLISSTLATGEAASSAATTKAGSLSLSLAGLTSVNVVDDDEEIVAAPIGAPNAAFITDGSFFDQMPDQLGMLLAPGKEEIARLGQAVEESRLLETDDMICDEIGPILEEICGQREIPVGASFGTTAAVDPQTLVDVSAGGAVVFSSGTGKAEAGTEGLTTSAGTFLHEVGVAGVTEVDPLLISNTIATVDSDAAVRTFGSGIGLGATGVASVNVVTYEPPLVEDGLPTANLVDVSVIGDIAFANSNAKADSAKVTVSSEGFTNSFGLVDDDESLSTSSSNAEGTVSGSAEAKAKSDPLTASLIASVSTVDIDPVEVAGDDGVFDLSLIASASFAADDYGKASGEASGFTLATGNSDFEIVEDTLNQLSSTTTASGTAATDVSVENGFGVGLSVIGSVNDVDYDPVAAEAEVDDTSFMVNYAAGQGKKVKSSATTTDAATTSTGEFDVIDEITGAETIDLDSNTVVAGSGSSAVQVAGGHQGEALSFMFADQEDFAVPGTVPVSNAFAAFGIEVDGCDDSPVTSTATLSDGTLLADADGDYPGFGDAAAHVEFTGIDALAQLQSAKNIATLTVADSVPDLSYEPAGGADVDTYDLVADTNSQPNLISYTRYGEAVSDQANLFVPDLEILPILTF